MPREAFYPETAPQGGAYSPAVRRGSFITTAGQCGYLPDKTLVEGLEAQIRQSFDNLFDALESAGCTEEDVVAVNVYLANGEDFDAMNLVYLEHFTEPLPARTTVTVGLRPGVLFEVNAQAVVL